MRVIEVDQREIQSKGGLLNKYPSAYIVATIIKEFNIKRIVDVTFGKGRFYRLCRRDIDYLVASDPVKWKWVTYPDEFYQMTAWQFYNALKKGRISFDNIECVVVDPPQWSSNKYRKREEYGYLIGSPRLIIEYGIKTAKFLGCKYLFLHYNRQLQRDAILYVVKYKWFARYLYTEGKNVSYYILYDVEKL